jgi:hypothetical protein
VDEKVVDTQRCRSSRNTRLLDFPKEFQLIICLCIPPQVSCLVDEQVVDTQRCRSSRNTRLLDFPREFHLII